MEESAEIVEAATCTSATIFESSGFAVALSQSVALHTENSLPTPLNVGAGEEGARFR